MSCDCPLVKNVEPAKCCYYCRHYTSGYEGRGECKFVHYDSVMEEWSTHPSWTDVCERFEAKG